MTTRSPFFDLAPSLALLLHGESQLPLYRQLYSAIQRAILDKRLPAGTRLPATRMFAQELGVSRNTVVSAFEQLLAEGYIESRVGDGSYVSRSLPDDLLDAATTARGITRPVQKREVSQRGELLAATPVSPPRPQLAGAAFRLGVPAIDLFPFETWSRLAAQVWRRPDRTLLGYTDAAGYWPLRQAIAAYLGGSRGVRCAPEQVIVVSGSQQGVDIAARVLLDPGDSVWFEDPGYLGGRGALTAAGATIVPVPVDHEGIDITKGMARYSRARMAYVTPSHQYPTGITMTLARRLALLDWARTNSAWIIEDDYDSEFRYTGRPLPALQGLDGDDRTIYVGSFSKVLLPALRLGYLVVPPDLVGAFTNARALSDRGSPAIDQAIVAAFMQEGHFARHVRRMRKIYAERQSILIEAARRYLKERIELAPTEAGMHLVGWLNHNQSSLVISQRAAAHGIIVPSLSSYALEPLATEGLLFGYAAVGGDEIITAVRRLATII